MKKYAEYESEYISAIGNAAPGDYVADKNTWITMKWTEDFGINPWDKNFGHELERISISDPELFRAVTETLSNFKKHEQE